MRHVNRWVRLILVAAAVASVSVAVDAQAQSNPISFGVTGGASKALAELGDDTDLGYHGGALLQWNGPVFPVGIRVDGVYHRFPLKDVSDANFNILAGTINGVFMFPTAAGAPVIPYVIGGAGIYRLSLSCDGCEDIDSENKFGINGGAGLSFPLSGFSAFVEARYHHIFTDETAAKMIPISFGLVIRP